MKKYVIGIDCGGTNLKIGLIDRKGVILYKEEFPTKRYFDKKKFLSFIEERVRYIIAQKRLRKSDLLGLGIGIPGLIDHKKGVVHHLTNIPNWKEVNLKGLLERGLNLPVYIDNDVNVMSLGELKFGSGRGKKNIVCLTLGTGVGGAIIIDGKLYRGSSDSAGEIGHVPINEYGPNCMCGSSGCLERYVGNRYIVESAIEKIKKAKKTKILKLAKDYLKITPEIISRAANAKDKLAIEIWREVGFHIGCALAGAINILNPEMIIIGGGVADAGEILFNSIKSAIKKKAISPSKDIVRIVRARLGKDAGLIGARVLVEEMTAK